MKTNLRYTLARLKSALFGDDIVTIAAYQHQIPRTLGAKIVRDNNGTITAVVDELDGKK